LDKSDIAELLSREDPAGVEALARVPLSRVLRYLTGRLCSHDEDEKWRAVRAIGFLVHHRDLLAGDRVRELLRRFIWAMSDESGAVPFGIPEALGEVLTRRTEFQDEYLPILVSMLTDEEMLQTGPIERGVVWALGRVGPPVASSSEALDAIRAAASGHPDPSTRRTAAASLRQITGEP
jgi:HEAT repeat protein